MVGTEVLETESSTSGNPMLPVAFVQAPITPVVEKENVSPVLVKPSRQLTASYANVVAGFSLSVAPTITEVEEYVDCNGEKAEYYVQSPPSADRADESPVEKLVPPEGAMRVNLRNPEEKMDHVMERATAATRKRNLEGNSAPFSSNSFGVFSNSEIMARASMMGIDVPSDNFENIDLLRELEKARANLSQKNMSVAESSFVIHHDHGKQTPLNLTWLSSDELEEPFTVVSSRKSRKKAAKKSSIFSRPVTRSQKKNDMSALPPLRFKC
jgi:hypothetical protein